MISVHKEHNILITSEVNSDHVNVLIAGELNSDAAPRLEKEVRELIENSHHKFVISLENLNLITSAGLRVLLVLAKDLHKVNGNIALYAAKPNVQEIFEITGFDAILDLCDCYENAIFAISSSVVSGNHEQPAETVTKTFH